jgi:hypothetical protein
LSSNKSNDPSRPKARNSPSVDTSFQAFGRDSERRSASSSFGREAIAQHGAELAERPSASRSATRELVRIACSPGSDLLEPTHQYLTSYVTSRVRPQLAERLSVAIYELLANALAYGSMSEDVSVELAETQDEVVFTVSNDTIAARIQMLNDHLAKVRANAGGIMLEEMRRSAAGGPRPMLGLARVVHEAGLDVKVGQSGKRVTVSVMTRR